jgi:hypothetical protein
MQRTENWPRTKVLKVRDKVMKISKPLKPPLAKEEAELWTGRQAMALVDSHRPFDRAGGEHAGAEPGDARSQACRSGCDARAAGTAFAPKPAGRVQGGRGCDGSGPAPPCHQDRRGRERAVSVAVFRGRLCQAGMAQHFATSWWKTRAMRWPSHPLTHT